MKLLVLLALFPFRILWAEDWIQYDRSIGWPTFKYPKSFNVGEDSFKGEGFKWTLFLIHPDKEFKISVSPYGYVSDSYEHFQGFKNPRDVVLISELGPGSSVKLMDGYEVFTTTGKGHTSLIFLKADADWGNCYDSLSFSYPEGKKEEYKDLIEKVVKSFRPKFLPEAPINEKQQTEQDSAGQPR